MTYQIYTLGCKVNEYESEVIGETLEKNGFHKDENPDVCIINTCTVTNTADSKSRKLIRSLKRKYPNALIVAIGCMIQNKIDSIDDLGIDIALGNKDKDKIVDYIKNYKGKISKVYDIKDMDFENMELLNSKLTRSYIKIQDGCDNYCAFCIIPYVRGHVRSKNKDLVLDEAKTLVKNGHKEIVLTGIHTGNYHDGKYDLANLLEDLIKIEGLERIRISSIEVTELNDRVLNLLKNKKIADHLHIPLQAGSDKILKLMNRKYDLNYYKKKIEKIRSIRPDISITTDIIVGFPEENDTYFMDTYNFAKEIKFSKIHVFPYSKREGTKAASMKQVDGKIKKQRVHKLLELSKELEINYMKEFLNKDITFIAEEYKDGYLIGHSSNYLHIKAKGKEDNLKKDCLVTLKEIEYPYVIGLVKIND